LDEPLAGLDLLTKRNVLSEIARLKSELGFAMILVTHDPVEVRALCDSLAVLEQGRISERGTLQQVAAQPKSALATAMVAVLPKSTPETPSVSNR
jgi:ABC-type glutathione transport system ATPase component